VKFISNEIRCGASIVQSICNENTLKYLLLMYLHIIIIAVYFKSFLICQVVGIRKIIFINLYCWKVYFL